MHLLLVSQDYPPEVGGIQTYAAELARRLRPRCDQLAVLAPRGAGHTRLTLDDTLPVYRLPARPDLLALAALPCLPVLAWRRRLDAAFHTQWQTAAASLVARQLTGYPRSIFIAAHGRELLFNPMKTPGPAHLYELLRRAVLTRADGCFPVSRYTAGLLENLGVPAERITVISNGTDSDRFAPRDAASFRRALGLEDRRVVLTVGRLVRRKGIDTMLQALPQVADVVPQVLYLIVGDGPDRARLEALAEELGVADRVRFEGEVPQDALPLYYNTCDLFVLAARDDPPEVEGFGLVFLEASACGKPVVGTRAGGIPDAVLDGITGLLVPPNNAAELAEALLQVLCNPAFAAQLGRQGRARVLQDASWDHVAVHLYTVLADRTRCE